MTKQMNRRSFMKRSAKLGLTAAVSGSMLPLAMNCGRSPAGSDVDVSVVTGEDTLNNTIKAVDMIGGMARFVPEGSKVAILPNSQGHHPGTFTKPDIVRAIVRMCKEAGAAEVNCLSWLRDRNWESTGLGEAVTSEGANLKLIEREDANFKSVPLQNGRLLKEARIMNELFANDVFIDIPITKDHAGNKFTGTMKNLMGLNHPALNRFFHTGSDDNPDNIEHLDQCVADLNLAVAPTLCIVDATEFITTNGPFGPGELINPKKIVAGVDRVAIDAYCATLLGMEGRDVIMIERGYEHGLGEIDLNKVKIKEVTA